MSLSTSNSNRYPKAFIAAFLLTLTTVLGLACFLITTDNLPAPMLTNSICMDEKLRFLRSNKNYQADYIVLGSSTGLNNFPSDVMLNHPEIKGSYLNYSAWGLNMGGKYSYWEFIQRVATPKVVIFPIDLNEFSNWVDSVSELNYEDVKSYLNGANPLKYYFKYHKNGLVTRIKKVMRYRKRNDDQRSLMFDQAGGAPLNVTEESDITRNQWKDSWTKDNFTDEGYENYAKLLKSFKEKGIIAVVVQQPLREHYKEEEAEFQFVKDHWDKAEAIARENGASFINLQNMLPEDHSLFSDSMHMNYWAADQFLMRMLEEMEQKGIFDKARQMSTQAKHLQ